MISYIKGTVAVINSNSAVIECNNIGYELFASSYCLSGLAAGQETKLLTSLIVKEDGITLYGFKDNSEKDMFLRLITVSGIGPKLAMGVLSGIDSNSLISCIAAQDAAALSGIKGVGKKTAERILLELKGKIKAESLSLYDGSVTVSPVQDDAVLALMALGYSNAEAVSALSKVADKEGLSTEDIIMAALRG